MSVLKFFFSLFNIVQKACKYDISTEFIVTDKLGFHLKHMLCLKNKYIIVY